MAAMAKQALKLYLLFLVTYLTSGLQVDIPQTTYEFARGDNVTIPCNFKAGVSSIPSATITWTAHADVPTDPDLDIGTYFYIANSPDNVDMGTDYEGRATLVTDISKGVSTLKLSSLKSKDTRIYQCNVRIPGDKTGKLSDTTSVVVLIAPSTPICKIEGKAEYYQDIKLTCLSEEGTPTPTYSWTNYDVNNKSRPHPPKTTDVSGVLSLYNISQDTSGYYICTSANKIRSATCKLTLSVMPPSMGLASTAGIIGAVVAIVVVLVIIIIICCCCRRKKEKSEEYAMGHPEGGEYTDKEVEEHHDDYVESKPSNTDRGKRDEDRSERDYDSRSDYDDRRGRSDDGRSDRYGDGRSDRYDDRRDRYDDRRSDRYDDRRDQYDDRRDRYDDRRDQYDDRRDRYDDRRNDRQDRNDDRRDRYDEPYNGRDTPPSVPPSKPSRG